MHEVCFGGFSRGVSVIVPGFRNACRIVCRRFGTGVSANGRGNENFFLQLFIQRTEYFYIGYVHGAVQRESVRIFILFSDLCLLNGGDSDPALLSGDCRSMAGGSGSRISGVFTGNACNLFCMERKNLILGRP